MNDESAAPDACRGELATRIDQFLTNLERAQEAPSHAATYHFVTALSFFGADDFEKGHAAIDKAERDAALPPEAADLPESKADFTTAQLRGAFRDSLSKE